MDAAFLHFSCGLSFCTFLCFVVFGAFLQYQAWALQQCPLIHLTAVPLSSCSAVRLVEAPFVLGIGDATMDFEDFKRSHSFNYETDRVIWKVLEKHIDNHLTNTIYEHIYGF